MFLGAQKNRLIETVLLITWLRNKKIIFNYALLSGGIYKIVLSDVFSAVMSHALMSHGLHMKRYLLSIKLDWLQSLKQFLSMCHQSHQS